MGVIFGWALDNTCYSCGVSNWSPIAEPTTSSSKLIYDDNTAVYYCVDCYKNLRSEPPEFAEFVFLVNSLSS